MVTSLTNYKNSLYKTNENDFYNGVVKVSNGTNYGTGSLLYDGKSIITAAHIFKGFPTNNITVSFDTANGFKTYNATFKEYPDHDSINANGDLAILTLEEQSDFKYQRYSLYSSGDEIGKDFTMVGYGSYGSGLSGELSDETETLKLKTQNTFEAYFDEIYTTPTTNLQWIPLENTMLTADFDNGYSQNDALGNILNIKNVGLGDAEGMIAAGDSGGPAFINNQIAGIASYTASISKDDIHTDINEKDDSSFGELGAWQKVSHYAEWIDKTIRAGYENAPKTKEDVKTSIVETDDEMQYIYFLLEYTGERKEIQENITLHYTTRDGSATAGEDYIALSGVITLYEDESSVAIGVEILPDDIVEENETFYIDVTSPSHGSFGEGITTLTAMKTIVNDDFFIA